MLHCTITGETGQPCIPFLHVPDNAQRQRSRHPSTRLDKGRQRIDEFLSAIKEIEHQQADRDDHQKRIDLASHAVDAAQHKPRQVTIARAKKAHLSPSDGGRMRYSTANAAPNSAHRHWAWAEPGARESVGPWMPR